MMLFLSVQSLFSSTPTGRARAGQCEMAGKATTIFITLSHVSSWKSAFTINKASTFVATNSVAMEGEVLSTGAACLSLLAALRGIDTVSAALAWRERSIVHVLLDVDDRLRP